VEKSGVHVPKSGAPRAGFFHPADGTGKLTTGFLKAKLIGTFYDFPG
jgi:hypothetical protein